MYGKPANVTTDELDLTCVHTDSNWKFDLAHRTGHCRATSHGPGSAIEYGEEAITGRCHLPASEGVQLIAKASVVYQQEVTPGRVSNPLERCRRVDDICEDHGDKYPFTGPVSSEAERPGARPFNGHPWFVANDPSIMTGRDLENRSRRNLERLTVVQDHMHGP
jgi:hypothetical protein